VCNNTEWNGQPIPLELEHKNGNNQDNSLNNLCLLCPNCHAQTSTYRGKNKSKA
jgi:predicted HNH restriction endonuclease